MSLEEAILDKVRHLPPSKQEEVGASRMVCSANLPRGRSRRVIANGK